jgi:GT2 family glycosyltransferase
VALEVIVVDNDSKDQSEQMVKSEFPEVKWIQTGYNAGFGRANNIGIRAAEGQYALILNSDTEFFEGTLPVSLQCHKALEGKGREKYCSIPTAALRLSRNFGMPTLW